MVRYQEEGALEDFMRERHERANELLERGLCLSCGESPYNQELDFQLCLDCWESSASVCGHDGCINSAPVGVGQGQLCEVHAVEMARDEHKKWLELKERAEELKEKEKDVLDEASTFQDIPDGLPTEARSVMIAKSHHENILKEIINSGIEVYPEGYDKPGELP